jgi:uncharacterized membrane protein YfcA
MTSSTAVLISLVVLSPFLTAHYIGFNEWRHLLPILASSLCSYWAGLQLIPVVKELTLKAGLFGRDLNKTSNRSV